MKKILLTVLAFTILTASVCCADEAPAVTENTSGEETIEYAVNQINERVYYKTKKVCYPLDISSVCNMGYADDEAENEQGGWSDQGPANDLASFNLRGNTYLYNIPFNFIEPSDNGGKSCIMLRGQNKEFLPLEVEIPVNDTAEGMYVLHGAAWGTVGKKAGKYGFVYEDGTSAMYEIIAGTHIADYWGTRTTAFMRTAWTGSNPSSSVISLNVFALNNPHPDKKIKSVKLKAYGDYVCMGIVGVTMVRSGLSFPVDASSSAQSLKASAAGTWAAAKPVDEKEFDGTILDSSKYLDAPAGKHGRLKADGENFVFADGTKAKFWGTNITGQACCPDKETAEKTASRIARCGYNLVRFVDMDKEELTAERLERLSYFQSLLKEKGIYTYFSLLGTAQGDGEDIKDGWKLSGLFDDELISRQKEFAKTLLSYKNKYTGMTFANDESVVMIDLANRNTMFNFRLGNSDFSLTSDKKQKLLTEKFNKYLKDKYKTTEQFKKSWKVVYDDESIEDGTVALNGNWKYGLYYDDAHRKDVYEFLGAVQEEYFSSICEAVKDTGYDGLITGVTNTWDNYTPYNSYSQSKYADFISVNAVNATGYGRQQLQDDMWYGEYSSITVGDTHDGEDFMELAENRAQGVPFVVSEWGTGVLSPTASEKSILMSVLAAQQNWTPIQYCFVNDMICEDKYEDLYSTYSNPVLLSLSQLTAALYYNTDELEKTKCINFNTDYLYKDKNTLNGITPNIYRQFKTPGFNSFFSNKSSVKFTSAATDVQSMADKKGITSNGGLYFDFAGSMFFAMNDKAIAFVGDVSKPKKYGRLYIDVYASYGYTGLVSKDGKDIEDSEKMLFILGSRTLNTHFNSSDIWVESAGEAPIIYEPLLADVTIGNAAGYSVYALDDAGKRLKKLVTKENADGSITFTVNADVYSLNYEIVKGE